MKMPLLSIITITYNAEAFIGATLNSLQKQTSKDFEYLVIDGKSKDKTLEILKNHSISPDILLSEPDSGLYDAMNKGLKMANGKYVWFMNAGDELAEKNTVEKFIKILEEQDPDVVYSDTFMIDESGKTLGLRSEILPHKVPKVLTWQKFNLGMLICHQSFISKKRIAPPYLTNNLSADIDWEINCLKKAGKIIQFEGVLSKYLVGGISSKQKFKSLKDRYLVLQKHFGVIPNFFNHIRIVLRAFARKLKMKRQERLPAISNFFV